MANFTQKAIKETFRELLRERPLTQITVKDIVERCGINRSSFYYHFQDIPSLIEEIVMEETDRIMEQYPTVDSLEMGFIAAARFLEQRRLEILHIYNSVNRDIFELYLWKVCDYLVVSLREKLFVPDGILPAAAVSEAEKEAILMMCRIQFFGMAMDWLRRGMKEDIYPMIHQVCELQNGILAQMQLKK